MSARDHIAAVFGPGGWQPGAPAENWTRPPVSDSAELRRILALPRRAPWDLESPAVRRLSEQARAVLGRENVACRCAQIAPERTRKGGSACIRQLNPVQTWVLHELATLGGVVGALAVGAGKTLLDILAVQVVRSAKVALLLVPPTLVAQLVQEWELLGEHWRVPSLVIHGNRLPGSRIRTGQPALHVFPYSLLSRPENTAWLEQLQPDLIIADEAHSIRHADTARGGRVLRHFAALPATAMAAWTGSITEDSITDYAHMMAMALKLGSPVPLDPEIAKEWATALDASENPAPAGALSRLCAPGEALDAAFHRRLTETPGVIATRGSSVAAEIVIRQREVTTPPHVEAMIAEVRSNWVRPDGEELLQATEVVRVCKELAAGFYHRWTFPRGEPESVILEWFDARKEWHRELRVKLSSRRPHLDSEALCREAAIRYYRARAGQPVKGDLPQWAANTWPRWAAIKDAVKPRSEAVRVDDFLARDAAEWGNTHCGTIWYDNPVFGNWISRIGNLPIITGGKKARAAIKALDGRTSVVISRKAHGTGTNGLQYLFDEQLIAQPMPSGSAWEQLLGRQHRQGFTGERLTAYFYRHTEELARSLDKALMRAQYVRGHWATDQKLIVGLNSEKQRRRRKG